MGSSWVVILLIAAVIMMAVSGFYLGWAHLRLALQQDYLRKVRSAWGLGGIALMAGMSLAILYGLRYLWPLPWLSIPAMYTLHGTLNALGFTLPALWGWRHYHEA